MNPEFRHLEDWDSRVGERGGTYGSHVRAHLWAVVFFATGFLCGVLAK